MVDIMNLKVVNDNVLVELFEEKEEVYIETDFKRGKVLAIGPGRVTPMGIVAVVQVEPGDIVTFNINRAVEIPYENNIYVITQNDILAYESKTPEEEV